MTKAERELWRAHSLESKSSVWHHPMIIAMLDEIDECKAVIAFLRHPGRDLDAEGFLAVLDRADKLLKGEQP